MVPQKAAFIAVLLLYLYINQIVVDNKCVHVSEGSSQASDSLNYAPPLRGIGMRWEVPKADVFLCVPTNVSKFSSSTKSSFLFTDAENCI